MRRMFNTKVLDQDFFLDMPSTARLLYYDLGVRADDDGFITPQRIIRMTGASQDDLRVLIAKNFLYQWEDGVVVLLHWREHNHVQSDRYESSMYYPRISQIKEKYALGARQNGYKMDTKRIQPVSKMVTQDRIGKDRIGKDRIDTISIGKPTDTTALDAWTMIVGTKLRKDLPEQVAAAERLHDLLGADRVTELLQTVRILWADTYALRSLKNGITNYVTIESKLEKLEAYAASQLDRYAVDHKPITHIPSA